MNTNLLSQIAWGLYVSK